LLKDPLLRRVFITALFFVFGLSTVFVALGASSTFIGGLLGRNLDWLVMVGGGIIILFGLHFIGIFRIPLLYKEARLEASGTPGTFAGAYIMGLIFAFGWTPCIGPILGAILTMAAGSETINDGMILLFVYSMGLGVPFLVAAFFIQPFLRFMTRFRKYLGIIEKVMGGFLILIGIMFITGQFTALSLFMLEAFPGLVEIEGLAGDSSGNISFFVAFLGGLLSFLSPCVLPLAPPYLAYLAGTTIDQLDQA